jgi:hypothetical protein
MLPPVEVPGEQGDFNKRIAADVLTYWTDWIDHLPNESGVEGQTDQPFARLVVGLIPWP